MIARKLPLALAVKLLYLILITEAQNARSYDTNDWIPVTSSAKDTADEPSIKRATGRVLNLDAPAQKFFPEEENRYRKHRPRPQQYWNNKERLNAAKYGENSYKYGMSSPELQPQKNTYKEQSLLNDGTNLPVFEQPPSFQQYNLPNYQPNIQTPKLTMREQIPAANAPNIYQQYNVPFNQSFYQSVSPNSINQELLGSIQNRPNMGQQIQQNFNDGGIATPRPAIDAGTVQLLYIPLENLKPNQPITQDSQNIYKQVLPQQNSEIQTIKQQRLADIQDDFIQQALQAHKLQQQIQLGQPLYLQTTTVAATKPVTKRKAHQPPLSVYIDGGKEAEISDVLDALKAAKSIAVQDSVQPNSPQIFVGPSSMDPPEGYSKFPLPYLNRIDGNRAEKKIDQLPFFVAPLSFKTPPGFSKIPLPSPHVGSIVVSNKADFHGKRAIPKRVRINEFQQKGVQQDYAPVAAKTTLVENATPNPQLYNVPNYYSHGEYSASPQPQLLQFDVNDNVKDITVSPNGYTNRIKGNSQQGFSAVSSPLSSNQYFTSGKGDSSKDVFTENNSETYDILSNPNVYALPSGQGVQTSERVPYNEAVLPQSTKGVFEHNSESASISQTPSSRPASETEKIVNYFFAEDQNPDVNPLELAINQYELHEINSQLGEKPRTKNQYNYDSNTKKYTPQFQPQTEETYNFDPELHRFASTPATILRDSFESTVRPTTKSRRRGRPTRPTSTTEKESYTVLEEFSARRPTMSKHTESVPNKVRSHVRPLKTTTVDYDSTRDFNKNSYNRAKSTTTRYQDAKTEIEDIPANVYELDINHKVQDNNERNVNQNQRVPNIEPSTRTQEYQNQFQPITFSQEYNVPADGEPLVTTEHQRNEGGRNRFINDREKTSEFGQSKTGHKEHNNYHLDSITQQYNIPADVKVLEQNGAQNLDVNQNIFGFSQVPEAISATPDERVRFRPDSFLEQFDAPEDIKPQVLDRGRNHQANQIKSPEEPTRVYDSNRFKTQEYHDSEDAKAQVPRRGSIAKENQNSFNFDKAVEEISAGSVDGSRIKPQEYNDRENVKSLVSNQNSFDFDKALEEISANPEDRGRFKAQEYHAPEHVNSQVRTRGPNKQANNGYSFSKDLEEISTNPVERSRFKQQEYDSPEGVKSPVRNRGQNQKSNQSNFSFNKALEEVTGLEQTRPDYRNEFTQQYNVQTDNKPSRNRGQMQELKQNTFEYNKGAAEITGFGQTSPGPVDSFLQQYDIPIDDKYRLKSSEPKQGENQNMFGFINSPEENTGFEQNLPSDDRNQNRPVVQSDSREANRESVSYNKDSEDFSEYVKSLQDQSVRSLLVPNLLVPTTERGNSEPVRIYQPASEEIPTTTTTTTTTERPTESTTHTRTRGRQRGGSRHTTSTTTRRSVNSRRPTHSTRTSTERPRSTKDDYVRVSTQQRFRTRGRTAPNVVTERVSTTENEIYNIPTPEAAPQTQKPASEQQLYPQFEHPVANQKVVTVKSILDSNEDFYQGRTDNPDRPILQYDNTAATPEPTVDIHINHHINENKKSVTVNRARDHQHRNVQSDSSNTNRNPNQTVRIRGKPRGRSRFATTTERATTRRSIVSTPERVEKEDAEEFYGFIRQPVFSQTQTHQQQVPLAAQTPVQPTDPPTASQDLERPKEELRLNFDNTNFDTTTVHFVGEIKPKYQTHTTTEIYPGTVRPKIRGRIRNSPKKMVSNQQHEEKTTRRPSSTRTRGRTHYSLPENLKPVEDAEADVQGGNYPKNFLQNKEHTTKSAAFQITIDPNTDEEEDQSPYYSLYRPSIVARPEEWHEASDYAVEDKAEASHNQIDDKKSEITEKEGKNQPNDRPLALPIIEETTILNSDGAYEKSAKRIDELFHQVNKFDKANEFDTVDRPNETTTEKLQKEHKRGKWKLVRHKPVSKLEVAESQNYFSVLNSFDSIQKVNLKNSEDEIKKVAVHHEPFNNFNPIFEQNSEIYDYESRKTEVTTETIQYISTQLLDVNETDEQVKTTQQSDPPPTAPTTNNLEINDDTTQSQTLTESTTAAPRERHIFDTIYDMFGFMAVNDTNSTIPPSEEETILNTTTTVITPTFPEEITEAPKTEADVESTTILEEKTNIEPQVSNNPFGIEPWQMKVVKTSTSTEITHETEICYRGRCIKSQDKDTVV